MVFFLCAVVEHVNGKHPTQLYFKDLTFLLQPICASAQYLCSVVAESLEESEDLRD